MDHILVKFFDGNVKRTVWFLIMLQMMFASFGSMIHSNIEMNPNGLLPLLSLGGFVVLFVIFYMIFTGMHRRQKLIDN